MNNQFLESNTVKTGLAPVDITTAKTGARVGLKEAKRVAIVASFGAGAGDNIVVALKQHTLVSGGTSKVLNIKANYYYKLDSSTSFTKVEVRPDDETLTNEVDLSAIFGVNPGKLVLEVLNDHTDAEGGFDFISLDFEAAGDAKVASCEMYLLDTAHQPAYDLSI